MVRSLVTSRPVLILVDLTLQAVPWAHWISVLKSGAATRRIPILAFGPHVDEKPLAEAIRSGADRALPRGAFLSDVSGWLESFAARTDVPALEAACREPISPLGRQGLELFNQGRFFEAHEVLEHAWMAEGDVAGRLYRVLLQLAVAYHHLREDNRRGASKMLLRIRPWLDPLPDRCRGVDLATVRRLVSEMQQALDQLPSGASTKALSLSTPSVPLA
jgi:predicted metal-dependent hydrolase